MSTQLNIGVLAGKTNGTFKLLHYDCFDEGTRGLTKKINRKFYISLNSYKLYGMGG